MLYFLSIYFTTQGWGLFFFFCIKCISKHRTPIHNNAFWGNNYQLSAQFPFRNKSGPTLGNSTAACSTIHHERQRLWKCIFPALFSEVAPSLKSAVHIKAVAEMPIYLFKFCLFLERGEGREKERERNINVWLLLKWPPLGTWPATQACALTGNWTGNPLVHSPHSIQWATQARAIV